MPVLRNRGYKRNGTVGPPGLARRLPIGACQRTDEEA